MTDDGCQTLHFSATVAIASFPGPALRSVASITVLEATERWAGPGNEASVAAVLMYSLGITGATFRVQ